ncbi:MAG: hypothetical protein VB110_00800 [Bacteroidales bacterium]|nr:hypothetical protein [Bacteroidales bacterium]
MNFPISSVKLEIKQDATDIGDIDFWKYSSSCFKVAETDFLLNVKNVAIYRVIDGCKINIYLYKGANQKSIDLFLNGSVTGAVLHQRGDLPFHGSSFLYNKDKGVIICGGSGTGKSSVTEAFCQNGSQFICDDISPVQIDKTETIILPIKNHIKLWDDALQTLHIGTDGLERIRPSIDKFYLHRQEPLLGQQRLDVLFILFTHNKDTFVIKELFGMEKYNALRSQIYRKVYLKGMSKTEKKYFSELFYLAAKVKVVRIVRPKICDIYETMRVIESEIY